MKKLALLASAAFFAASTPSMAQLGADTGVGADAGVSAGTSSDAGMNAAAGADIGAAVSAMSQAEASASEIGSLTQVTAVEVIEVDAQAQSDASLSGAMSENQESIDELRDAIAANEAVLTAIEAEKPGFDVNTVLAANVEADGTLKIFTRG